MVSVIIPNYNYAKYLNERIDSVFSQTYQDYEVIILDDCSTDDSKSIIEKYRNNPKTSDIIYNDINSGSVFKQWKKGISLAKGDYIWIAESDDFASTDFLEKLVPLLIEYNASLAFSDSMTVDENSKEIPGWRTLIDVPKKKSYTVIDGNYYIYKEMLKGNRINNASAVVFNKENALKIQNFDEYKLCGDWFFWINIMLDSRFIYFNKKLNFFRQHTNRFTSAANKNGFQYLEGLDVAGFIINRFSLHALSFNKLLSGGDFYLKIKHDKDIISENIRDECFKKCLALFKYKELCIFLFCFYKIIRYLFKPFRILKNKL
jgi:glycosyltransferase involved in cell wall biosynthesis